jgi:hypothetical protein
VVRFAVLKKVELLCFERLSEETEFLTTVLRLMIHRGCARFDVVPETLV